METVEKYTTIDGQNCTIKACGGKQGRRLVLRLVNLLKPEPESKQDARNVAASLINGGNGDDSFVEKADKLLSEILSLAHIEVQGHMVPLTDDLFDSQFIKRYDVMLDLLVEVMTFNGFFEMLGFLQGLVSNNLIPGFTTQKT